MESKKNIAADIENLINIKDMSKAVISNPISKSDDSIIKIDIKKILMNNKECFQFSYYTKKQVKHTNISIDEMKFEKIFDEMEKNFKQCNIFSNRIITILMNKKKEFKLVSNKENDNCKDNTLLHNKEKNYILKEGKYIDWLYRLGIMSKEGKVLNSKQKKFRQINKFLEMISDVEKHIPDNAFIVDMGCGKSYLTFALYYFLNIIRSKNVKILGIDLKKDVVENCIKLSKEFEFDDLEFTVGDISCFNNIKEKVDMVVTLHACDTATDYALFHAVNWNCSIIMSVPCCQHEVFGQIKNENLSLMLSHGIIKERFSSLLTDSLRAAMLDLCGYKTNIVEFIDLEDTPKNIMIRAVKKDTFKLDIEKAQKFIDILKEFNIEPTIYRLLKHKINL